MELSAGSSNSIVPAPLFEERPRKSSNVSYTSFRRFQDPNEVDSDSETEASWPLTKPKQIFPRRKWITGDLRQGETISPHRAVMTLAKSMLGIGCFSLPYAWSLGGLWFSSALQIVVATVNWYGCHVIARSAQRLSVLTGRPALDYGHLAKKASDYSDISWLRNNSKTMMYIVNINNTIVQIGCCSVGIVFVADNLQKIFYEYFSADVSTTACCTIMLALCLPLCLFSTIKVISIASILALVFIAAATVVIVGYCISLPSQWRELPAATDFLSTMTALGMMMYTFEGQQLVLPIENKLEHPNDFLHNCGVLPTTMALSALVMCIISFYGYTAFGSEIATTISINLPVEYSAVNICLAIQSLLGFSVSIYAVYDFFWNGFQRKVIKRYSWTNRNPWLSEKLFRASWVILSYLIAISVPKLDVLMPFIGCTAGSMGAIIFPISIEIIIFMPYWRETRADCRFWWKLAFKVLLILFGLFVFVVGLYANTLQAMDAFSE